MKPRVEWKPDIKYNKNFEIKYEKRFYKRLCQKFRCFMHRLSVQLYPNRCPVCGKTLYDTLICGGCLGKLKYVKQPVCCACGKPLTDECMEYCMDCSSSGHEFRQGKAVFCYQGPVRDMLYRYKYSNRRDYTEFFAREAARLYAGWIKRCGIQAIIPVPLSKKKRRRRGYNQAELFARRLAGLLNLPCEAKLLVRARDTAPQKKLSRGERKNNLKNAFKITENIVKLDRVLLVDDIYTTGSTIDAAALVLKQAGVREIYFLCISIGQGQ